MARVYFPVRQDFVENECSESAIEREGVEWFVPSIDSAFRKDYKLRMPKTAPRPWKIYYTPPNWKRPPMFWSSFPTQKMRDMRLATLRMMHPDHEFIPA